MEKKKLHEEVAFVVIQTPDYCGGHRIEFFGYTKHCLENALEIAEQYAQQPFTYILSENAQEGDCYNEHREPLHEEAYDTPVIIRAQNAMFVLE